ncbi:MAG: hypothetical protein ACI8P9_004455, partial [Parasphingorhabdus sp.]
EVRPASVVISVDEIFSSSLVFSIDAVRTSPHTTGYLSSLAHTAPQAD